MDRRQFLKFLAQSSASVGATVFVERVWGFPMVAALSRNNNKLFHWGVGSTGFAGTTGVNVLQPSKILPRHNFLSIQTTGTSNQFVGVGFTKKGDILTWGYNANFQQGPIQGTVASPVLFGTTTTWSQVNITNTHAGGIRPPGTLWTWGDNASGQLGNGALGGNTSSPVQIAGFSDWTSVQPGISATFAMRTAGTLWVCGANNGGYLGNGLVSGQTLTPTQVTGVPSFSSFAVGKTHILAVSTIGQLWTWGQNIDGQLGVGDVAARSLPIQVGGLSDWSKVYASNGISFAIKTDGTLWAWGYNGEGELGLGDIVSRSSPTRVGALTDWQTVSVSLEHTLALKNNGTLWGWGTNDRGQLNATLPSKVSSPTQIGSNTSWISIATVGGALGSASFGIRTK